MNLIFYNSQCFHQGKTCLIEMLGLLDLRLRMYSASLQQIMTASHLMTARFSSASYKKSFLIASVSLLSKLPGRMQTVGFMYMKG